MDGSGNRQLIPLEESNLPPLGDLLHLVVVVKRRKEEEGHFYTMHPPELHHCRHQEMLHHCTTIVG